MEGRPMRVNFYATLRPVVGARSVEIPLDTAVSVRGMVDAVVTRYPSLRPLLLDEQGDLVGHVHVFIDGRDAPYLPGGLEATIGPDSTVDIYPAVAGG
jgi:molybdopterin synthase sulfur carrier subunit